MEDQFDEDMEELDVIMEQVREMRKMIEYGELDNFEQQRQTNLRFLTRTQKQTK